MWFRGRLNCECCWDSAGYIGTATSGSEMLGLVRNVFETAIRQLANRIMGLPALTKEILTTLEPGDVAMNEVPAEIWSLAEDSRLRLRIVCVGCGDVNERGELSGPACALPTLPGTIRRRMGGTGGDRLMCGSAGASPSRTYCTWTRTG